MLDWLNANAAGATALFTLVAAAATVLAALAALVAVWVSLRNNARALQRDTELAAAKWLFDAHMKLHEDKKLNEVFYRMTYGDYNFRCEGPGQLDLNTEREEQLVYFLDFLNSVETALRKNLITILDLDRTTIGFAIRLATKSEPIQRFMTFTKRRDEELRLPVHAWGAIRP